MTFCDPHKRLSIVDRNNRFSAIKKYFCNRDMTSNLVDMKPLFCCYERCFVVSGINLTLDQPSKQESDFSCAIFTAEISPKYGSLNGNGNRLDVMIASSLLINVR